MISIWLNLGVNYLKILNLRYACIVCISFFVSGQAFGQKLNSESLRDSVLSVETFPPSEIALPIYQRINKLSREEGNRDLELNSKIYISYFNDDLGNTVISDEEAEEVKEIVKDTTDISTSNLILAYQWIQQLERKRGNLISAIDLNKKYIELELTQGANPEEIGISYMELGSGYRIIGDFENAILFSTKAMNLFMNAPDSIFIEGKDKKLRLCRALQIRGLSKKDLKKYEEAIQDYNKSISFLKESIYIKAPIGIKFSIESNIRLAHVYLLNNQLEKAEEIIQIISFYLEKDKQSHFRFYELLALLNLKKNEPLSALIYINKALEVGAIELEGNEESPEIARLKMIYGQCFLALDSLSLALRHFHEGLQYFDPNLNNELSTNPDISIVPEGLQTLQLLEKKAETFIKLFSQNNDTMFLSNGITTYITAIDLIDKMKSDFINEGSKYRVAEIASSIFPKALEANFMFYQAEGNKSTLNSIYNIIEKNKAEILFQNISTKYSLLTSELPKELIDQGIDLKYNISYYSKLLAEEEIKEKKSDEKIANLEDKLFKLNESFTFYDQKIKTNYPDFHQFKDEIAHQVSVSELQDALHSKEILLEYFQSDNDLYILSIHKDKIEIRKESMSEIEPLLTTYVRAISAPPSNKNLNNQELNQISYSLSKLLFLSDPNFTKDIRKITIIPDGILSKIPFESLVINEQGRMLLEQCNISYNYSANQFYGNIHSERLKDPEILGISPIFEGLSSEERSCNSSILGEIPYAQQESNFLASNFEGKFFNGNSANITNLKDYFEHYPIIHLATHACLNKENPMLSQIYLSDGGLTTFDIQNFNSRPEFVILSACNTASGQIKDGEGVIGLSRGFFEAGVKGMQSSLWSINDRSSANIVTEMYRYLKKGKSKSEALRLSKLEYLKSADKLRSHPYYWAAMIHIGNDNPIEFSNNSKLYWILGFATLLILILGLYFNSNRLKS